MNWQEVREHPDFDIFPALKAKVSTCHLPNHNTSHTRY
jgi:hypothetical protein